MSYNGGYSIGRGAEINQPNVSTFDATASVTTPRVIVENDIAYILSADGTNKLCISEKKDISNIGPVKGSIYNPSYNLSLNTMLHPVKIGEFYYSFGAYDIMGSYTTRKIYKCHKSNPHAWVDTGAQLPSGTEVKDASYYVDDLYVYIFGGHRYTSGVSNGTTANILRASVSSPTTFTNVGSLPEAIEKSSFIAVGNYIYLYGGDANGTPTNKIYRASKANPLVWTNIGAWNYSSCNIWADSTNVYLYGVSLGNIYADPIASLGNPVDTTVASFYPAGTALVESDGYVYVYASAGIYKFKTSTPTDWVEVSKGLPAARSGGTIATTQDRIYYYGGNNSLSAATDTIYSCDKKYPSHWKTEVSTLPATSVLAQVIKTSKYIYLLGNNGTNGNYYRASINTPTTFTLVSSNGPPVYGGQAFIYGSYVFYCGGTTSGGTRTNIIRRATIIDGEIADNSWTQPDVLPVNITYFNLVVSGSYVYIFGGYTGSASAAVYRTSVSNGVFGTWTTVTSSAITTDYLRSPILANNKLHLYGGTTLSTHVHFDMNGVEDGYISGKSEPSLDLYGSNSFACNNTVYLIGGILSSTATSSIFKASETFAHTALNLPIKGKFSIPTVSSDSGALGSLTYFQRSGMLPWTVQE